MSKYHPEIKILASDYHRNGVGGAGFTVTIFKDVDPESDDWGKGRRFLAIQFEDTICPVCHGDGDNGDYVDVEGYGLVEAICQKCGGYGEIYPGNTERTAVIDLDEAAKGNVYMFGQANSKGDLIEGTGDNAWRGADYFGKQIATGARTRRELDRKYNDRYYAKLHKARKAAQAAKQEED